VPGRGGHRRAGGQRKALPSASVKAADAVSVHHPQVLGIGPGHQPSHRRIGKRQGDGANTGLSVQKQSGPRGDPNAGLALGECGDAIVPGEHLPASGQQRTGLRLVIGHVAPVVSPQLAHDAFARLGSSHAAQPGPPGAIHPEGIHRLMNAQGIRGEALPVLSVKQGEAVAEHRDASVRPLGKRQGAGDRAAAFGAEPLPARVPLGHGVFGGGPGQSLDQPVDGRMIYLRVARKHLLSDSIGQPDVLEAAKQRISGLPDDAGVRRHTGQQGSGARGAASVAQMQGEVHVLKQLAGEIGLRLFQGDAGGLLWCRQTAYRHHNFKNHNNHPAECPVGPEESQGRSVGSNAWGNRLYWLTSTGSVRTAQSAPMSLNNASCSPATRICSQIPGSS